MPETIKVVYESAHAPYAAPDAHADIVLVGQAHIVQHHVM
jgi:hypothetical protein